MADLVHKRPEWVCPRCTNTGAYRLGTRWVRCMMCNTNIGDPRTGEQIAANVIHMHAWREVGMIKVDHYECALCPASSADTPRVWSKRAGAELAPPDAVYVGRPSPWGNPYRVDSGLTQEEAVSLYREWITRDSNAELRRQARRTLRGKHLVCWCHPLPCHADVLLEIANAEG